MIFKYGVECPGCKAQICLRVSVGLDTEQPFYFVCTKCNSATRGKQIIWYEPNPGARIEFEDAKQIEIPAKPDQTINIHPDLPAKGDAQAWEEEGFPFIMNHFYLGDNLENFYSRLKMFRGVCDNDWFEFRRLFGYYLDKNWTQFDLQGKKILEEEWALQTKEWHRHDYLHKLLDLFFAPLWIKPYYPNMKMDWNRVWSNISSETATLLRKFAKDAIQGGEIANLQRDIFHCIEMFVNYRSSILPGLPIELYVVDVDTVIKRLRLFRDDFPKLRDLYVSTFEVCHSILKFVLGVVNVVERGEANNFGEGGPKNLANFGKMPNAKKQKYFVSLSEWQKNWPLILDRRIRNAISHHSIRHDLSRGILVNRDNEEIPYLEFVVKCGRLVHPILIGAHILKSINIMNTLFEDWEEKGTK